MSQDTLANNKRIAKNTIVLYVRMIVLLLISLYTSRVVLEILGFNDFGIYNVVGGVVGMFAILSRSLSNSIGRFLTVELGKEDYIQLNKVFCTSINILVILSFAIFVISEIVGLWLLYTQMNIPEDRLEASFWVFQFSVLTFIVGLISVPYNALIVSHEDMGIYAYISIFEAVSKLVAVFILSYLDIDKLILWAFVQMIISLILRVFYGVYCGKRYSEIKYSFLLDRRLIKEIGGFTGWSFIGETAGILKNEGTNILLNVFFNPIVNAANAIAMQINGIVLQFAGNFTAALNPQIIKLYASKQIADSYRLVLRGTKFSFFLFFIVSIPIFINTHLLLSLWLKDVPEYTVSFVRLIVFASMMEIICYPMIAMQRATGKMRNYQIVSGTIHLLNFPISWLLLNIGVQPHIIYIVAIVLGIINIYARLYMLKRIVDISIKDFFNYFIIRSLFVMVFTFCFIWLVHFSNKMPNYIDIIFNCIISIVVIYCIGLNKSERQNITRYIRKVL